MTTNRANAAITTICAIPLAAILLTGCAGLGTETAGKIHSRMEIGVTPPAGESATVRGIVHQILVFSSKSTPSYYGFVIQNTPGAADRDSSTSDGLYVDMHTNGYLRTAAGGIYRPHVGDEVRLKGVMGTSAGQTVLQQAEFRKLVRSGLNIDDELQAFVPNPPDDAVEAEIYWRQHEGMRCKVPAGAMVSGAHRDSMGSMIYLIHPSHPLLRRKNVYARRAFRDPHPLDDKEELFDNQNGYLIGLGPLGLARPEGDSMPLFPETCTFETLKEPVMGAVARFMGQYMVQVESLPVFEAGADPSANRADTGAEDETVLRVATFNVENLYDHRDDPFDARDYFDRKDAVPMLDADGKFQGYSGLKLYDYVPASREIYKARLSGLAGQIIEDLQSPDILMLQEVEDQDIGTMEEGKLVVSDINNRDGQLDALQELALEIRRQGGPVYETASDRAAADDRGIITGFLYQPGRVTLADMGEDHPVMGGMPCVPSAGRTMAYSGRAGNPKAFNLLHDILGVVHERGPQMAAFDFTEGEQTRRIYLLNNHFKSQPQNYVPERQNQAKFSADLVRALRKDDKKAFVIVGGDLNTFPRPDEPDPMLPTDQLGGLYEADLVNLYDEMLKARPENAYSYVFKGQAQTLDHLFVTESLHKKLKHVTAVHINSDFAGDEKYPRRGHSDHDPIVAGFQF